MARFRGFDKRSWNQYQQYEVRILDGAVKAAGAISKNKGNSQVSQQTDAAPHWSIRPQGRLSLVRSVWWHSWMSLKQRPTGYHCCIIKIAPCDLKNSKTWEETILFWRDEQWWKIVEVTLQLFKSDWKTPVRPCCVTARSCFLTIFHCKQQPKPTSKTILCIYVTSRWTEPICRAGIIWRLMRKWWTPSPLSKAFSSICEKYLYSCPWFSINH